MVLFLGKSVLCFLCMGLLIGCSDKQEVARLEKEIAILQQRVNESEEKLVSIDTKYSAEQAKANELAKKLREAEDAPDGEVFQEELTSLEKELDEISQDNALIQEELEKL